MLLPQGAGFDRQGRGSACGVGVAIGWRPRLSGSAGLVEQMAHGPAGQLKLQR
jgi:hypothetical protein